MRKVMSYKSRRELLFQVASRYREADRKERKTILSEFVASTGYARKYAIRLLNNPPEQRSLSVRRARPRKYGPEVEEALAVAWAAANFVCGKRLVPFLPTLVPALEQHGHLSMSADVRDQLLSVSAATVDRLLSKHRRNASARGISTTKAGKLLKKQVPVRTFADWDEGEPGFVEADLVAHCGPRVNGAFVCSLVITDVATGWRECQALLCKSQDNVILGLERAIQNLPFKLKGFDTDNGSEFLNHAVIDFCTENEITFTRGRAYRKNDQCFVEQKNGSVVRQIVGYDRFEGPAAQRQLNELYRAVRHYVNSFQPSMKVKTKERLPGGKQRRKYDQAQTPLQRLLKYDTCPRKIKNRLVEMSQSLDPIQLLKQIQTLQDALWRHAVVEETPNPNQTASQDHLSFHPNHCSEGVAAQPDDIHDFTESKARRGQRKKKPRKPLGPRTWRTRKDPFEAVSEELFSLFCSAPELSTRDLLQRIQKRHSEQDYPDKLLRTLQRRVKEWRAETIIEVEQSAGDPLQLAVAPLHLKAVSKERELAGATG